MPSSPVPPTPLPHLFLSFFFNLFISLTKSSTWHFWNVNKVLLFPQLQPPLALFIRQTSKWHTDMRFCLPPPPPPALYETGSQSVLGFHKNFFPFHVRTLWLRAANRGHASLPPTHCPKRDTRCGRERGHVRGWICFSLSFCFLSTGHYRPAVSLDLVNQGVFISPGFVFAILTFNSLTFCSSLFFSLSLYVFFFFLCSCCANVRAPQKLVLSSRLQQRDKRHKKRKTGRE